MKAHLPHRPRLELWGGVEGTVNRVGDRFTDQTELSGHAHRRDDLDLFASLGIKALRYPILWERTAPDGPSRADWSWADERLGRLRELGIRPIVGLVHHGSGPSQTSLVDPWFPDGLATFARAVAERYPWVDAYTPVNEPLTTARFSGLYGHWYPHGRDDRTFVRALLTQCRAVVLSMRAIREVLPVAQLIQTDDLGKTYGTPLLAYQATFENERRWITFDLLCGRVDRGHYLWRYLRKAGASEAELTWFAENPCPPDIIGVNHYLSGERFLDERLDRYPIDSHGGNGRHAYADVLALRVLKEGADGPAVLLREAWERYRLPIAVTEAHNGCTREEQLRWLLEVWDAADGLRRNGADVRAVTAWSLLGAHGWDSLVTRPDGRYEPGVFDLRGPRPRPTAVADVLRALATGSTPDHPVLAGAGWWRRPERLFHAPISRREVVPQPVAVPQPAPTATSSVRRRRKRPRPLLIVGPSTVVVEALTRVCEVRGLAYHRPSAEEVREDARASIDAYLCRLRPWAVINAAGRIRVDGANLPTGTLDRQAAQDLGILTDACARHGLQMLAMSSDLVFDGTKTTPYVESDRVSPVSVHGKTVADSETRVLHLLPSALVVRSGPLFGPWDGETFVSAALRTLATGRPFVAADDVVVSPTYLPDLIQAALDVLIDGEQGVWHLATPGSTTWADLARHAARQVGLDADLVIGRPARRLGLPATTPPYSVLGSERGTLLPPLDDALSRYHAQCDHLWTRGSRTARFEPDLPRRRSPRTA